jgi:hypothetical protein
MWGTVSRARRDLRGRPASGARASEVQCTCRGPRSNAAARARASGRHAAPSIRLVRAGSLKAWTGMNSMDHAEQRSSREQPKFSATPLLRVRKVFCRARVARRFRDEIRSTNDISARSYVRPEERTPQPSNTAAAKLSRSGGHAPAGEVAEDEAESGTCAYLMHLYYNSGQNSIRFATAKRPTGEPRTGGGKRKARPAPTFSLPGNRSRCVLFPERPSPLPAAGGEGRSPRERTRRTFSLLSTVAIQSFQRPITQSSLRQHAENRAPSWRMRTSVSPRFHEAAW